MSLEKFRRTRMVVLRRSAAAYQAARAMEDNHIGAILIGEAREPVGIITDRDLALTVLGGDLDPVTTTLGEVMTEGVVACDIGADLDEVVRVMREHAVRRVPITENGRLVGLVTFDDLVLDGSVGLEDLRFIVTAQLEAEAPQKPAGMLHPAAPASSEAQAAGRTRALMRARARAEATYGRMLAAIGELAGLDRDRSERVLLLSACMLCRRLVPQEAQHLIAQLPSKLRSSLDQCLDGPDRAVTAQAIEEEAIRALGLDRDAAHAAIRSVFKVIAESVSPGQVAEVRGQLPEDMRDLFPAPEAA